MTFTVEIGDKADAEIQAAFLYRLRAAILIMRAAGSKASCEKLTGFPCFRKVMLSRRKVPRLVVRFGVCCIATAKQSTAFCSACWT